MPLLARRRPSRLGRRTTVIAGAVVVALAAYGAASYFGAHGPSATDDLTELGAAALRPDDVEPLVEEMQLDERAGSHHLGLLQPVETLPVDGTTTFLDGGICGRDLAEREAELLRGVVVAQRQGVYWAPSDLPSNLTVLVSTFENPVAARRFADLHASDAVRDCQARYGEASISASGGRVAVVVVGVRSRYTEAVLTDLANRLLERLEIEG